jgi:hypothetical protein
MLNASAVRFSAHLINCKSMDLSPDVRNFLDTWSQSPEGKPLFEQTSNQILVGADPHPEGSHLAVLQAKVAGKDDSQTRKLTVAIQPGQQDPYYQDVARTWLTQQIQELDQSLKQKKPDGGESRRLDLLA